jgi:hypothetical protein
VFVSTALGEEKGGRREGKDREKGRQMGRRKGEPGRRTERRKGMAQARDLRPHYRYTGGLGGPDGMARRKE